MKFVAVGDTHFGHRLGRPIDGRYPSEEAKFLAFQHAISHAEKIGADAVLHCGDVFDTPNPSPPIKKKAISLFERILERGMDLIVIPGNHDRSFYENNLLQFYYPNFHILNAVGRIDVGDVAIVGFPYTKQPETTLARAIRVAEESRKTTFIICHQIFRGATVGPQRFVFKDGLPLPKLPPHVPFIISGHIHRSQQLHHVLYTGSIERTGFPETIEPKGCLVIDTDRGSVKFKEVPTYPMKVVETDFESALSFEPDFGTYTLLRIVGKSLSDQDLTLLHHHLRQFPLLMYSPKTTGLPLEPLYANPPPFHPIMWEAY